MQPPVSSPQQLPSLAIIGASTRSAAASALRAGFQPLSADLFADADLRRFATATRISPYPEGFLDWIRAVEPTAWIYTGALENHPELVDQLAWIAPLWGNPGDVLAHVRDPRELEHALRSAGLLFPETRTSADGLPQDGSWLAKTYTGASGSGVRELRQTRRLETTSSDSPSLYYQRRVAGTPCAAVFVAVGGKAAILGVSRQLVGETWLGANQFQYCGSIGLHSFGPQSLHEEVLETIDRIGDVLAKRFELMGLFGVDFVADESRVWTIEVNPRFSASVEIVERATGIAILALHADACGGPTYKSVPFIGFDSLMHGKALVFAKRDVTISKPFFDWSLAEALKKPWPTLADVSSSGTLVEKGRPILTVFAEGQTDHEVELRLRERAALVEGMLYSESTTQ